MAIANCYFRSMLQTTSRNTSLTTQQSSPFRLQFNLNRMWLLMASKPTRRDQLLQRHLRHRKRSKNTNRYRQRLRSRTKRNSKHFLLRYGFFNELFVCSSIMVLRRSSDCVDRIRRCHVLTYLAFAASFNPPADANSASVFGTATTAAKAAIAPTKWVVKPKNWSCEWRAKPRKRFWGIRGLLLH